MHASFIADPAWWVDKTEALMAELPGRRRGARMPKQRQRVHPWSRSPCGCCSRARRCCFLTYRLLEIVEQAGAVVVADEMCSGTQRLYHPVGLDEGSLSAMLRASADRALLPCTCPCFDSGDGRIDWLLQVAKESRAQGVIHHTLRLCQLYDLEQRRVSEAFKDLGVPFLNLHTEHGTKDSAVIQNRIEAFLEMLQQY